MSSAMEPVVDELPCVVMSRVNMRQRRPPVYWSDPKGFDEDHAFMARIEWCLFADIAKIITGLVIEEDLPTPRTGPSISGVSDFINRFGLLCGGHVDGHAILTWVTSDRYAANSSQWPPESQGHWTFFPKPFAEAAIDFAAKGIRRVSAEQLPELPSCDLQHPTHRLVAHHVDGKRYLVTTHQDSKPYRLGKELT